MKELGLEFPDDVTGIVMCSLGNSHQPEHSKGKVSVGGKEGWLLVAYPPGMWLGSSLI